MGSRGSDTSPRRDPGLLSRPCRKRRPSAREDGGVSGVSSSCGARGGFLPRHDEDLREPLVRRQGSQVSMRVARGPPRPSHPTPCPPHGGMLLEPTFEILSRLNRARARRWGQVSPDVLMAREPPTPGLARPAWPRPRPLLPSRLATPPGHASCSRPRAVPAAAFAPPRLAQQPAVFQVRPRTSQPVGGGPAGRPVRAPATAPHRCSDPPSPPKGPRPLSPDVSRPGPPVTSAQGTRWRDFHI